MLEFCSHVLFDQVIHSIQIFDHSALEMRHFIQEGIRDIENKTCIQFKDKDKVPQQELATDHYVLFSSFRDRCTIACIY